MSLYWTIRPDGTPDWADTEPDPVPVPTIAWLAWHIGWWWSVALDHANGRTPRERTEIVWPGAETAVAWLRGLREEWLAVLDRVTDADLDAWLNSELMKNVSEIGQLRMRRRSVV